jgi:hypothetical protein
MDFDFVPRFTEFISGYAWGVGVGFGIGVLATLLLVGCSATPPAPEVFGPAALTNPAAIQTTVRACAGRFRPDWCPEQSK